MPGVALPRVPLGDDLRREEALVPRLQLGGAEHVAGLGRVHVGQGHSAEQRGVERVLEHRARGAACGLDQQQQEERGADQQREHRDPRGIAARVADDIPT